MRALCTATLFLTLAGCAAGSNPNPTDAAPDTARTDIGTVTDPDVATLDDATTATDAAAQDTHASFDAGDVAITLGVSDGGSADSSAPPGSTPAPPAGAADPCASGATPPATGDLVRTIDSSGTPRWYYLHVPPGYNGQPTQLVLNYHGFTSDPFQQALLSRMNPAADARNFIVAYPAGIAWSWNAGQCCGHSAWVANTDDVQFTRDTIDAIAREYCVDRRRVYATGMSNGGFLSHRLACELSDRIAAVAPVAGVRGVSACEPARAVPVLHIHGTTDGLVPYYGGSALGFPSVPATYAAWSLRHGCFGLESRTYERGDSRCEAHSGCNEGAEVILCTVEGGGHTWPGGLPIPPLGHTTMDLDATSMMLDFFARHPMP